MTDERARLVEALKAAEAALKRIAYGGGGPEGRFLTAGECRDIAHAAAHKAWLALKALKQEASP